MRRHEFLSGCTKLQVVHGASDGGVRRLQEILGAQGCKWCTLRQFKIRVADGYTGTVANSGMVTIVVNHGATKLVTDSDRGSGLSQINGSDRPSCGGGATPTSKAPTMPFPVTTARGDCGGPTISGGASG